MALVGEHCDARWPFRVDAVRSPVENGACRWFLLLGVWAEGGSKTVALGIIIIISHPEATRTYPLLISFPKKMTCTNTCKLLEEVLNQAKSKSILIQVVWIIQESLERGCQASGRSLARAS